jgi:hypothetical protein
MVTVFLIQRNRTEPRFRANHRKRARVVYVYEVFFEKDSLFWALEINKFVK